MTTAEKKRLSVELPVCPVCSSVGKHPGQSQARGKIRYSCDGPFDSFHKRVKMEFKLFEQVEDA